MSFLAGAGLLVIGLLPQMSPWPAGDFRTHMLQHLLIGMLAPLGLVLGAPVTLLLRSIPRPAGRVVGRLLRSLAEVAAWARETRVGGARVIDEAWVQQSLARIHAKAQVLRLMNWKQAWAAQKGQPHMADSSAIKVYGSELSIEAYRALLEVMGAAGMPEAGSPGAALRARIESAYCNGPILTFGGGTNEVQRDIIAMAGLGMPHYKD